MFEFAVLFIQCQCQTGPKNEATIIIVILCSSGYQCSTLKMEAVCPSAALVATLYSLLCHKPVRPQYEFSLVQTLDYI